VLAGGRGSRLGGAKASVLLAGRPLLAWALDALRSVVKEAVVVAKPDTPLPALEDVEIWREPQEGFHPRHGILHALRRGGDRTLVVLPVDMPLVPPALLAQLLEAVADGSPAAIPRAGGRLHPLCGAFTPEAIAGLAAAGADEPLVRTLESLGAAIVGACDHESLLVNVNTPGDLRRAAALLADG
jgi:molybdopterin-guanine dinucleotide biosynthesis protein A